MVTLRSEQPSKSREGYLHAVGTSVVMVELLDAVKKIWLVEVAIPNPELVGGSEFELLQLTESALVMSRHKTLAQVSVESEREFQRLVTEREKGDLFYEPRADSLYVWELETGREISGTGYRDYHKSTNLYVTRDLAVLGACEEILRYYGDGYWSKEYREKLQAQMAAGKHEEAMGEWSSRHQALRFVIRNVEVRASSEPYKISVVEPKES